MAAASSSLSQNIADVVGQDGATPLTSLQIHFIQNMIHETLEEFRSGRELSDLSRSVGS